MSKIDFKKLITQFKHFDEQGKQSLREFFIKCGGDFDRGDIIVLNENLYPELRYYPLHGQFKLSDILPNNIPSILVPNNPIEWNKQKGILL